MRSSSRQDELWSLIAAIPSGKVVTYGDLGKALSGPVSGLIIGRWMASCPPDLPWWRVISKSGEPIICKRNPDWAREQMERLAMEGTPVLMDGRVDMEKAQVQP